MNENGKDRRSDPGLDEETHEKKRERKNNKAVYGNHIRQPLSWREAGHKSGNK